MVFFKFLTSGLNPFETISTHPYRAYREWYIELPRGYFALFDDLAMTFLNQFQLPLHYDVGTELLSTFWQYKATHISDHIQEWHRRKWLIKSFIPPEFSLSGSSSCCYLTSWRMFLHPESKMRNNQSLGIKSWIWSTLNPDFCMRLYLMLCI